MAIKVSGTEVITNNSVLQNVTGLKTVGGESILGSGDISAGGGISLDPFTITNGSTGNTATTISNTAGELYFMAVIQGNSNAKTGVTNVKVLGFNQSYSAISSNFNAASRVVTNTNNGLDYGGNSGDCSKYIVLTTGTFQIKEDRNQSAAFGVCKIA